MFRTALGVGNIGYKRIESNAPPFNYPPDYDSLKGKGATLMKKKEKLISLVDSHMNRVGSLFMPDGPYGGLVYLVDDDGFQGPHCIPDWVVPASFSKRAYNQITRRLSKMDIRLEELHPDDDRLDKVFHGIDTSYGGSWTLEPYQLLGMLKAGCRPDTLYLLPPDFNYEDFEILMEDGIRDGYPLVSWESLSDDEIDHWLSLLNTQ